MFRLSSLQKVTSQSQSPASCLAAIDLGTNSFHIVIVQVRPDGTVEPLTREKESVRLGQGSANYAEITPESMERGLACLKRFKNLADSHNANIIAIGTSALREAENRKEFLDKAEREIGIRIEVVSGNEEARLIYLGILQGLPIFNKRILLIDIGGGSTELLVGEKGEILFSTSLKLGAVRLTERFLKRDPISISDFQKCRIHIESVLSAFLPQIESLKPFEVIGSSGSITSIASMILEAEEQKLERLNGFSFSTENFKKVRKEVLEADTTKKRQKIPGLEAKRTDIIVAGILVLDEILHRLKADSVTVSDYALREGIIHEAIRNLHPNPKGELLGLDNIRKKAILTLSNLYPQGKKHAETVTKLTLKLFDILRPWHELGNQEREYLEAACQLHQIGLCISHHNYHKHSYYIIRNAEGMVGFSNSEIEIIALLARYHRKGGPKQKHEEFRSLRAEDQILVKKLASFLRIGDGLDRSERGIITNIMPYKGENKIKCIVYHNKNFDPNLELWSVSEKKDLFEDTFAIPIFFEAEAVK